MALQYYPVLLYNTTHYFCIGGVYKMANKIDVRANVAKNRLYMALDGFFSDEEAKQTADKGIAEASKLKAGFDIVNDIRGFKPTSPNGAAEIKRALIFCKQQGLRHVIRVVDQAAVIGEVQFSRQSKDVGLAVDTATSVEEADKILDAR
jgi:hypothetical protein